jgi:penicillin amidase
MGLSFTPRPRQEAPGMSQPTTDLPLADAAPRRRRLRLVGRVALALLVLAAVAVGVLFLCVRALVRGSLPQLDGELRLAGLSAEVRVERDGLGVPTVRGHNRADVAFATGFVHAQDRYFQMDLMRRHAAGELAELIGPGLVAEDRRVRVHRFRDVARRALEHFGGPERAILTAYVRGVEAGRRSLAQPPFEYILLRTEPTPWQEEDTVLVALGMFLDLQGGGPEDESVRGLVHDTLPAPLAAFLLAEGSPEWDAPLEGPALAVPPIPGPDVLDLRKAPALPKPPPKKVALLDREPFLYGSNNWAVAGAHTTHGGAIVANDMHLWLRVPNVWYRALFVWPSADGGEARVVGATLPGTPVMVVGSNTHVAWGFTNTEGDWSDLIVLEPGPDGPDSYLTPGGPRKLGRHEEIIRVKGGAHVQMPLETTVWGPVYDHDHKKRRRALRWAAHDPAAINFDLIGMETARTLEDALDVARRSGMPGQNVVIADDRGRIAWTVSGLIPRRVGFDGRLPTSWADGRRRWDGWLGPKEHPTIVSPPEGRLWTANNRVVGGAELDKVGHGNYDVGARAKQIRDDLREDRKFSEADMLAIQLDDRALFLARWQELLLKVLTPEAVAADPRRGALRDKVSAWGARASVDSVGFRVVRAFRQEVHELVLEALTRPCKAADARFQYWRLGHNVEGPVWRLVQERPAHLLPPGQASWDALLLHAADLLCKDIQGKSPSFDKALDGLTWGRRNTAEIEHPFSREVPGPLRWWLDLDMPHQELPGAPANMPRVQTANQGASQRMAVSPGREGEGYFHMPGGQSGHPLSPHYRDGHAAWAEGRPAPLLPGPAAHTLTLRPQ